MSAAASVSLGLIKETRALLPAWAACASVLVLAALTGHPALFAIGLLAYGLGTIAIGAQAVGHEYTHRTLALLLSQPADRRRLFAIKLASLAAPVATLGILGFLILLGRTIPGRSPDPLAVVVLVTCCSLFLAPALTMAARSSLAGTIFTVAIVGLSLLAADIAAWLRYRNQGGAEVQAFKTMLVTWSVLVACAAAAIASWRMFARLQVVEGHGPDLGLPAWLGRRTAATIDSPARRAHPLWLLAWKELRLQQMTFALAGAYTIGCLIVLALRPLVPTLAEFPIVPVSIMYLALLSILIGAMASAEERQLGTHQWQLLLPIAVWKQWMVKAGVVLGLAVVLGVGMPAALALLIGSGGDLAVIVRAWQPIGVTVVLLAAGSLYVSTLCGSGIKAMAASIPFVTAAFGLTIALTALSRGAISRTSPPRLTAPDPLSPAAILLLAYAAAVVVSWALRLGLINHRYEDRSTRGMVLQLISIAVLLGTVTLFSMAVLMRG